LVIIGREPWRDSSSAARPLRRPSPGPPVSPSSAARADLFMSPYRSPQPKLGELLASHASPASAGHLKWVLTLLAPLAVAAVVWLSRWLGG